ncbi:MAG: D-alanine--D-alanine ligase [Sandaracinaceae bacterium]
MPESALHVAVVLGDPRLPYAYAPGGVFGSEETRAAADLERALQELPRFRFTILDDHGTLHEDLRTARPDLVLNLCDVGFGNVWTRELHVPALCETLDLPYTGAGPVGIVLSNDKELMAAAARARGVLVPRQELVDVRAEPLPLPSFYPTLVKPNVSGGSAGITERSLVHDEAEARACLEELRPVLHSPEVLYQEYLPGRELTVGLLGNPREKLLVLPPLEVDYGGLEGDLPPILTHGSKADPSSPYWNALTFVRAEDVDLDALRDACVAVFERLEFRDYARFDFRAGADGAWRLIDANINPTWVDGGKMAVMASWAGLSYAQMLERILDAALRRQGIAA